MKVRLGFVSNSSSSSFVIASKTTPGTVKLTIPVDISDLVDETIKDEEELIDYFKEHYDDDFMEDEKYKKMYDKFLIHIKQGFVLYTCQIANDDDNWVSRLLYEEPDFIKDLNSPQARVIHED